MYEEDSEKSGLYDIPTAIANAIRKFGQDLQICIPVIVTEDYDPESNIVKVVPLTRRAFSMDGDIVQKNADEFSVAVMRFGVGKFLFVYPIKKGTTGWVFSSDRDTYSIKEKNSFIDISKNEGPQDISSFDMGKYTQGFFIPDRWIPDESYKTRIGHVSDEEDDEYDFSDCIGFNLLNDDNLNKGVYISDDLKITLLNDKKRMEVDASAEYSIATEMKIEGSSARAVFDGESLNVTLSDSNDTEMENSGIEISVDKNGKIEITGIGRTVEIDLNNLPEGDSMRIAPMWFPMEIQNEKVKYEKYNVIVGSVAVDSKEDEDMT